MALALLVATYALTRPADERAIYPLLPALRSVWLQVHVLSAAIGYGACGVSAGRALPRVLKARGQTSPPYPLSCEERGRPMLPLPRRESLS